MVRIVISGASGLIGRALTASLTANGAEVVALTRDPAKTSALLAGLGPTVRVAAWDGRSAGEWRAFLEGGDAVVNLTGESLTGGRWSARKKQELLDSRLRSINALLEALRTSLRRPRCFVQASAVGYYGPRGDERLDETALPGGGLLAEIAQRCESESARAAELGMRLVAIRTGVVLDRHAGALPRLSLPYRMGAGGFPGSGNQWVSWIHIDDEVRAIRFLLERSGLSGAFNLTAPGPVTMKELCRAIGDALRRPTLLSFPGFALRAAFGEMADEALLRGQRAVPVSLQALGFTFRFPTIGPALEELFAR